MIKTNSPYYISVPWSGFESYILKIYIWSGLEVDAPVEPQYQIKNINPLGFTEDNEINISNFINDFISYNLPIDTTTSLNNGGNVVWVKVDVTYPNETTTNLLIETAIRGYTYGIEGKNAPLVEVDYFEQKVGIDSVYLFSFIGNSVTINGNVYTNGNYLNSDEICQVAYIKVSEFTEDLIEISLNRGVVATLIKTIEPRYIPIDIVFINKNGMLQSLTFFKEKVTTLKVDRESYENNFGQPIDGEHQFKDYNVNGRTSFSMNSGFVTEENNEIFKQLFLSQKVWHLENGIYIPLNLKSQQIEYKSRQKDRLLNYKVDFEYSYKEINNI